MIALQGEYNDGVLVLKTDPPTKKAKVIVIFQDVEKETRSKLSEEDAMSIFNKYTGCVDAIVDEKEERMRALDEKYESAY